MPKQVRLTDDVVPAIEARMAADDCSASEAASRLIREWRPPAAPRAPRPERAAAPTVEPKPGRVPKSKPTFRKAPPGSSRGGRARARRAAAKPEGPCPHPLLRRIGDQCAACGETV